MKHPLLSTAIIAVLFYVLPGTGRAEQDQVWFAEHISGPETVVAIRPSSQGGFVKTTKGWHSAVLCGNSVCLSPGHPPKRERASAQQGRDASSTDNGLTDGWVAQAPGRGLVRAWYTEPDDRYGHGILGDAIEAGAVIAESSDGKRLRLRLPETAVFEDLTPRLADLDGDGQAEIIAIKSYLNSGASLSVYARNGESLSQLASTPPIGTANRWLNIAGIADFDGNGTADIAIVVTPHIGGTLEIWSLDADGLKRTAALSGFSNHAIGSRNLDLSIVADADGDGLPDLAVPDAERRALRIVAVRDSGILPHATVALPKRIVHNMAWIPAADGPIYLLGLSDGSLVAVRRRS